MAFNPPSARKLERDCRPGLRVSIKTVTTGSVGALKRVPMKLVRSTCSKHQPLPACGERSPLTPSCAAGEGGSPSVAAVESPPHPNPLPSISAFTRVFDALCGERESHRVRCTVVHRANPTSSASRARRSRSSGLWASRLRAWPWDRPACRAIRSDSSRH
jgi:hypothetical protein